MHKHTDAVIALICKSSKMPRYSSGACRMYPIATAEMASWLLIPPLWLIILEQIIKPVKVDLARHLLGSQQVFGALKRRAAGAQAIFRLGFGLASQGSSPPPLAPLPSLLCLLLCQLV